MLPRRASAAHPNTLTAETREIRRRTARDRGSRSTPRTRGRGETRACSTTSGRASGSYDRLFSVDLQRSGPALVEIDVELDEAPFRVRTGAPTKEETDRGSER